MVGHPPVPPRTSWGLGDCGDGFGVGLASALDTDGGKKETVVESEGSNRDNCTVEEPPIHCNVETWSSVGIGSSSSGRNSPFLSRYASQRFRGSRSGGRRGEGQNLFDDAVSAEGEALRKNTEKKPVVTVRAITFPASHLGESDASLT